MRALHGWHEHWLLNWEKSTNNPLQTLSNNGYWITSFYNAYNGKIYLLLQRDAYPDNTIECWSFLLEDWETPANWTDEGIVYTGIQSWDDLHIEPHSVIFETQAMADAREGVASGLGTRKWRLYYCGCHRLIVNKLDWSIGFLVADEEDPTNWSYYSGNPIFGWHNDTFHTGEGTADSSCCIFRDQVWMAFGKYNGSMDYEKLTVSDNGIDGWVDCSTEHYPSLSIVWGSVYKTESGFVLVFQVGSNLSAYYTEDGETLTACADNPILSGTAGAWDASISHSTIVRGKTGSHIIGAKAYLYYISGGTRRLGAARVDAAEEGFIRVRVDSSGAIRVTY